MKLGKAINYEILIKPTSNQGFIVQVGCKQFCFEGRNNLIRALNKYLQDPEQLEKDLAEKEPTIPRLGDDVMDPSPIGRLFSERMGYSRQFRSSHHSGQRADVDLGPDRGEENP